MDWFTNYIRKEGEAIGEKRGKKEGRDETLLNAYTNMKNANCKDNFICAMLGISTSKLRQIKKMAVASPASV